MQLRITEIHILLRRLIQTKSHLTHLIGRSYPLKVIQALQGQPDLQGQRVLQDLQDLRVLQVQMDLLDLQALQVQQDLQDLRVQTQQ